MQIIIKVCKTGLYKFCESHVAFVRVFSDASETKRSGKIIGIFVLFLIYMIYLTLLAMNITIILAAMQLPLKECVFAVTIMAVLDVYAISEWFRKE